jgi:hypothetical protein
MVTAEEAVSRWRSGVQRADTTGLMKAVGAAIACSAKSRSATGSAWDRVKIQGNCVREAFGLPPIG